MKKVSAKVFFAVMCKGVCQVLERLMAPFGYKKEGKFAKCVWGLFATSAAVVMCLIAIVCFNLVGEWAYNWYERHYGRCDNPECWAVTRIAGDIYYHDHETEKGYVFNKRTGETLIKHVAWIVEPNGEDSLVCFRQGEKRGYFSKNTGKVVIEPKYDHAWIFSEGLASVEENGYVKFIDGIGKVVLDKQLRYDPDMDGYVFHEGYCVVKSDDGKRYGVMDRTGKMVLPMDYYFIDREADYKLWLLYKGDEMGVLDKTLKPVIPLMKAHIYICDGTIDMTMPDHTMRKYDYDGSLINDFYISGVRMLEYEKEELYYPLPNKCRDGDDGDVFFTEELQPYHPKATARLRAYVAGDGYEGLMTADGHVVMMPRYLDIEAIGQDLYLCTSTNTDKVIVNGRGEIVR